MGGHHSHNSKIGALIHDNLITEKLGRSSSDCVQFDDWAFLTGKFNYKLASVHIWSDSKYITGIQSIYDIDGGKLSPGCHLGATTDKKVTLNLGDDEFIVRVYVRSGDWIDAIRLETNKGNFIEVGGKGGELTLFDVPQGFQFIAFAGETQKHLQSLQIKYDKIW